jgi:biopolymer transport protein ExbD
MRFTTRKRRPPPAVIIVSLIDILIVMLIFLMVTTSFKQNPAVKLVLPESRQARQGATDANLQVTIAKQPPYLYLGAQSVTLDRLQAEVLARVHLNPNTSLSIRADTDAPFGQVIKVMDIAKAAKIKAVDAFTQAPAVK